MVLYELLQNTPGTFLAGGAVLLVVVCSVFRSKVNIKDKGVCGGGGGGGKTASIRGTRTKLDINSCGSKCPPIDIGTI